MLAARCNETVAEMAARLGVSERQAYRIRAKEREGRAGWGQPREERLDRFDYEYMELADLPTGAHAWCTPEGQCPEDRGTYNVGGQVRSLRGGQVTTDETGPTKHQPDPDGLKGGVG